MRKQVPIDLELVQMAFEDRDGDGQWYLDRETGEAVRVSELDDDELRDHIEDGFGERYIHIPYQGSDAGYRDMAEFIDSVTGDRETLVRISESARPRADPAMARGRERDNRPRVEVHEVV